jgi:GNAT superfamily N-acetyltransferase
VHAELASEAHHESLADLLCEVHAYYSGGASASRELVRSYLVETLLAPESPLKLIVAGEGGGGVAGFAAISLTYSLVEPSPAHRRHCWLKELYVRSGRRGGGVGRTLMSWVARYAVDNGCCRIDWPVKDSEHPRHRLLRAPGCDACGGKAELQAVRAGAQSAGVIAPLGSRWYAPPPVQRSRPLKVAAM